MKTMNFIGCVFFILNTNNAQSSVVCLMSKVGDITCGIEYGNMISIHIVQLFIKQYFYQEYPNKSIKSVTSVYTFFERYNLVLRHFRDLLPSQDILAHTKSNESFYSCHSTCNGLSYDYPFELSHLLYHGTTHVSFIAGYQAIVVLREIKKSTI